jgi:peptidyl-prolyl cis-trans isomerase B (cyclophilin B)
MSSNGGVMMNVFSGACVNMFQRGMVVFGLIVMVHVLVVPVVLAEEPTTGKQAPHVLLKTKFGEMEIVLFPDLAPKQVASFLKLTKSGFYNGTIFHRILPGFMIQGGDPLTKDPANRNRFGTGGPGYTVPAEFSKVAHEKGILSAARTQDPNSAGSQFFIMVDKSPHLDGKYTVFGEIVKGVEVAETIVSQPRDLKDNPVERIEMTIEVMK